MICSKDMLSATEIMQTIDSIFENANIYQSILFIDDGTKDDLYDKMCEADYPVVQYSDAKGASMFLECNYRCLLVSESDLLNFTLDTHLLWENVNMVVCCNKVITTEQLGLNANSVSVVFI